MNRSKLLAAVAVMAMVFATIAVVSFSEESDAEEISVEDNTTWFKTKDLGGNTYKVTGELVISGASTVISNGTIDVSDATKVIIDGGKITGVTFIGGTNAQIVTEQNLSEDVTIEGCIFEGDCVCAVYIGLFTHTTNTITLKDNAFNGTYSEGAVDFNMQAGSKAKIIIEGSNPTSINMWAANGNATAEIGTNLDVSEANIDKINMSTYETNAPTLYVPDTEELDVGEITGDGTLRVDGTISAKIADSIIEVVGEDAIVSGMTIELTSDMEISADETVSYKNCTINGNGYKISVEGTLNIDDCFIYAGVDVKDGGEVNVKNSHKLTSTGTVNSDVKVGYGDELSLSGTIPKGLSVKAYGKLIVSDLVVDGDFTAYIGSEVVVEGKMTVSNRFTMQDAELTLDGKIDVKNDKNGGAVFKLEGDSKLTVTENGEFTVKKATSNGASANSLIIELGENMAEYGFFVEGTLSITGTLTGIVHDMGTVVFNGTSNDGKVLLYDGITFTVTSVSGELEINDVYAVKELVGDKYWVKIAEGQIQSTHSNGIVVKNVKGFTVTEKVSVVSDDKGKMKYYYADMLIAGTLTSNLGKGSSDSARVSTYSSITSYAKENGVSVPIGPDADSKRFGEIRVVDDIAIGENVILKNFDGRILYIDGNVVVNAKNAEFNNKGVAFVNGLITNNTENGASVNVGTMNASFYTITDSEGNITNYYSGFSGAVDAILTADDKTIVILGNVKASEDKTVPKDAIVDVQGKLTIADEVTVTVADGAAMDVSDEVIVEGTLSIENTDNGLTLGKITYQVYVESGKSAKYTNLVKAIEGASEGDVITLVGDATVKKNLTIPAGITVKLDKSDIILGPKATMSVEGTLDIGKNGNVTVSENLGFDVTSKMIAVTGVIMVENMEFKATEFVISGAYFEKKNVMYISNAKFASENCDDGSIMLLGSVSVDGVTFTEGKDKELVIIALPFLKENGESYDTLKVTAISGNMTLVGATFVTADDDAKYTGSISSADSVMEFSAATNFGISSETRDTVDGTEAYTGFYGLPEGDVKVASGTVEVMDKNSAPNGADLSITNSKDNRFTVVSGATLLVPADAGFAASGPTGDKSSVVIDGTMVIKANVTTGIDWISVPGELVIAEGASVTIGKLEVSGKLTVNDKDDDHKASELVVGDALFVGSAPETIGATGTVSGAIDASTGIVIAYPGSDVSAAKIDWNDVENKSNASKTAFTINGELYATIYTSNAMMDVTAAIGKMTIDIPGLDTPKTLKLYKDSEMKDEIVTGDKLANVENVYAEFKISIVTGTVSAGTGLAIYVDGVLQNGTEVKLTVGEHDVRVDVKAGYEGTPTIMFNGQTVTDGKIVITADMENYSLTAEGATPANSGGSSDSGDMGITDYLLIILVVMVVILAIVVIMRMMRS